MFRRFPLLLLSLATVAPAGAGPLTTDACPGGPFPATIFAQVGNDILENLLFTPEGLWVSDGTANAIKRFAPDASSVNAVTGISSPGGLVLHPDGLIYAGQGNSLANALMRTGAAKVMRFDPAAPAASIETFASGLNMPNGMTVLPDGDLAISNDLDRGLIRIPYEAPTTWAPIADVWGTNGLVVSPDGETLYAAITFDQRSPIERIDLASGSHSTAAQLTFGVASLEPGVHTDPVVGAPLIGVKGLDDMTGTADGALYPVANGTGELLRVDPNTGASCLLASGLQNPSSVRIAPEASGFADGDPATTDFYVTEFSGAIRIVRAVL